MLRINPFPHTWKDITRASLYLGKPFKDVEKTAGNTKLLLSVLDERWLNNKTECKKLKIDEWGMSVYYYDNTVYLPTNYKNAMGSYDTTSVMVLSFCIQVYDGNLTNINKHFHHYTSTQYYYGEIDGDIRTIQSNHISISQKYQKITKFALPDYKELLKSAKRMKIKAEITNEGFILDMGKCECGNDIEGTIKYKSIILYFDFDWNIKRVKFVFTDWILDTKWNLHTHLHPHIGSSPSICFGNRLDDFVAYQAGNNFPFMLDLIKETCNSYSPEHPYLSVKQIGKELIAIKAALPKFIKTNPNFTDEEAKSQMLYRYMREHRRNCPSCGSYMIANECTNENCLRNPLAEINCSTCQSILTWDDTRHMLICPNLANHNQPVPIPTPTQPDSNRPTSIILDDPIDALLSVNGTTATFDANTVTATIETAHDPIPMTNSEFADNYDSERDVFICRVCGSVLEEAYDNATMRANAPSFIINTEQPAGWYCDNNDCGLRYATQVNRDGDIIPLITNLQ